MSRTGNRLLVAGGVVAVVLACLAAYLVLSDDDVTSSPASPFPRTPAPTRSPEASPSPARSPQPSPPPDVSPFTGRAGGKGRPVLAVKIDNVEAARPPTALAKADLVYIEPVEAGLSRILAVYSSRLPHTIGPIRSARQSDIELLRQFGRPAFAYSGAQSKLLPLLRRAPFHDVSPSRAGAAYVRGSNRPAPHNLYARPRQLLDQAPRASGARDIGFRFGAPPGGGHRISHYRVRYPAFRVGFLWSADRKRWIVSMDGERVESFSGGPPQPSTVVIQHVAMPPSRFRDSGGNVTPYVDTVGSGRAVVLRDGRAYQARWSRPRADGGTSFTTRTGEPMRFAPGQIWTVFAEK